MECIATPEYGSTRSLLLNGPCNSMQIILWVIFRDSRDTWFHLKVLDTSKLSVSGIIQYVRYLYLIIRTKLLVCVDETNLFFIEKVAAINPLGGTIPHNRELGDTVNRSS